MQVRQMLIASVLAVSAACAMSQEIDRSETLQGRSLAAQQAQTQNGVTRETAVTQERVAGADGQSNAGERASAPDVSWAKPHATTKLRATKTYAKTWLHGDRRIRTVGFERA